MAFVTYTGRVEPERDAFIWLLHHPRVAGACVNADGNCLVSHFEVNAIIDIVDVLQRYRPVDTPVRCRVTHGSHHVMLSHREGVGRDDVTEPSPGWLNMSPSDSFK
jgi:hypothetical protein